MSSVNYRSDIQGLRAIAVIAVMMFHFNPALLPGGFIGVDVFLVISGFLITSILLQKKSQADYSLPATLKYFYSSRFKRIAPAYFVMLVLVALIAAVFFLPQDFNTFTKGLEKAVWFNSNSYFANFGDYFAPANYEQPLLHTWSLAVEIQFYLLAPLMVVLFPLRWLKWIFACLLIGLTATAEYRLRLLGIEQATYYSLYARLPEFFAGALAALYTTTVSGGKTPAWHGTLGLLIIILAAISQPLLGPFPGIAALLPVVGSVLLLSQPTQGWVSKLLTYKTLVWIGALSYSLYLWHWPVLAFLRYYTGTEVLSIEFSLLFVVLTFMLSAASYYGVERAFRTKRTNIKQTLGWGLLAAGVLGIPQVMAKVNVVFTPEKLPIEYRRYANPATICHGKINGDCLKGDLSSDREILVLGDSHAAMLNHFFDYLGKELGFKARIITASSCLTIPGFDVKYISEWARDECRKQIERSITHIRDHSEIIVAGMWTYQLPNENNRQALLDFIVNNPMKKIAIMQQVPELNAKPFLAIRMKGLGIAAHVGVTNEWSYYDKILKSILGSRFEFYHIDNSDFLKKNTLPYFNDELLYFDESHLNEVGSLVYATHMKERISGWLNDSE